MKDNNFSTNMKNKQMNESNRQINNSIMKSPKKNRNNDEDDRRVKRVSKNYNIIPIL